MVCDAGEHHAGPAVGPFGPKDVVPGNEGTRVCGEGSTTSTRRSARPAPKTWCPATKEQGIAGRGAPRPPGGRLVRSPRRGARRRRNKGLRGGKHHAGPAVGSSGPQDVVPGDEGTRVCGEGSTTPARRSARSALKAWCPATKKQGFAGSEAPRRP